MVIATGNRESVDKQRRLRGFWADKSHKVNYILFHAVQKSLTPTSLKSKITVVSTLLTMPSFDPKVCFCASCGSSVESQQEQQIRGEITSSVMNITQSRLYNTMESQAAFTSK